jgi:hypothetical protein
MSKTVANPSQQYRLMSPYWEMITALWGGTAAMRAKAGKYLPQEPAEPEAAYAVRVQRSVLTNYYKATVNKLVGKIFKQDITLNEDIPAQVKPLLENVDRMGTDINRFSQDWVRWAINDGLCHVLVDSPTTKGLPVDPTLGQPTLATEKAADLRPYLSLIKADSLIGWDSHVDNGKHILDRIRVYSCRWEKDPEDEFNQIKVEYVRVIEPGLHTVYRKGPKDDEYKAEPPIVTTDAEIQLVTLYTNETGFMMAEPMLLDLAYLNVTHWQSDSDQRNILHVARVPILFVTGVGDDPEDASGGFKLVIGPNSVNRGPQGADMKYVEHTGAAIEAGVKDLEQLELRMAAIGIDAITKKTGDVTATARALDQGEIDSPLQVVAKTLEDCVNKVLDYFAKWYNLGDDAGGTCETFKDFGLSAQDAQDVQQLLTARANKDISRDTLWFELKRRGLLSDKFDPKAEASLLEVESTTAMEQQAKTLKLEADAAAASGEDDEDDEEGGNKPPFNA